MKRINYSTYEEKNKSKGSHFEDNFTSWNDGYFGMYQTIMDAVYILMYQVTCF